MSTFRSAGRSVSGRRAASSARSMPYFAISSAALAVSACASSGVTPSASALASSLRTRASSAAAASGRGGAACWPGRRAARRLRHRRGTCPRSAESRGSSCPDKESNMCSKRYPEAATVCRGAATGRTLPSRRTSGLAWPGSAASPGCSPTGERRRRLDSGTCRADGPQHPVRRFRPAGRRGGRGHRRGRLAARGCHGQPLRAQPHPRPAGGRGAAQARRAAAGLPPDDRGPGPVGTRRTRRPGRAT